MRAPLNMQAHVLPALSHSLISIGKFCDAGCTATFNAKNVTITHKDQPILQGHRNTQGLWTFPTPQPTGCPQETASRHMVAQANFTIHDALSQDIVRFLHLSLFSPTRSTLLKAVQNNHFVGWPAMTESNIKRYLTIQEPTILGHMDQQRQNARSTKPRPQWPTTNHNTNDRYNDTDEPQQAAPEGTDKTLATYISMQDLPTGRIFTDQTGPFPVVSAQGVKAAMILYDYDSNSILVEGITSRGKTELLRAYNVLLQRLIRAGLRPKMQRMDNEVSNIFKVFLQEQDIELELTPAHVHRRNAAERAIRTWKNHFMAGLASLNPRFPVRYWSHLIKQSEMTLNLLRQSRINPKLSAYAQVQGNYDFNKNPMAPPGCEIIAFQPPAQRPSWGYHGIKAWYTQPAMNHYRCVQAITSDTGREITVETVQYLPHNFRMPRLSSTELAAIAAHDLAQALRRPPHPAATVFPQQAQQTQDFRALSEIYTHMTTIAANQPPPRVGEGLVPNPHGIAMGAPRVQGAVHQANKTEGDMTATIGDVVTTELEATSATLAEWKAATAQCHAVFDPDSGRNLEYRQLIQHPKLKAKWLHSAANEFGRLAQGIRDIPGTNTIAFIPREAVPKHKKVTYGKFVTDIRPQKEETHRTRLTIGGNLIDYPGDVSAPTGGLVTYKLHCNDIISTKGARCMNLDIHNYYLNTPLPEPEYMKINLALIPEEIIKAYQLETIADDQGNVFIQINKGMYGLPQAGILAYQLLVARLAPYGYYPVRHTPGYWKHKTKQTAFVLVVDDFSVKFLNKQDAEELLTLLRKWYEIKVDWGATLYCGITTAWDYEAQTVTLSMPGYINTILKELNHPQPRRPQNAPHPHIPPQYGPLQQLADLPDDSAPLPAKDPYQPAQIVGKLLYYARAVDSTMNVALSSLASEQNKPTLRTKRKLLQLLDYCATHPQAQVTYHNSAMQLHMHSDAGYNSEPGAKSRAGGHLFMGMRNDQRPINNGAVLNPTHILKHVASSAADAEIGAAFINCKEAIPIRITLGEMGHAQQPTPVTLDNTTAVAFVNKQLKQRRTKAIDMRYYWLQDQEAQQHFAFKWEKGENNKADYFTKHHAPSHHQLVRQHYVNTCQGQTPGITTNNGGQSHITARRPPLRGCADPGSGQWTDDGQTMSVGRLPARTTPGTPMTNGNSPTGPTDIPQITQTFTLNKLIYY